MATQKNTDHTNANISEITLQREGTFWRAYEQSAYLTKTLFWQDLKVNGSYMKDEKQELLYVGFPTKSLETRVLNKIPNIEGCYVLEQTSNKVVIRCLSIDGFEEWKQSMIALRQLATGKMQPFNGSLPLYKAVYDFFVRKEVAQQLPERMQQTVGDRLNFGLELDSLLFRLLRKHKEYETERQNPEIVETIQQIRFLLKYPLV